MLSRHGKQQSHSLGYKGMTKNKSLVISLMLLLVAIGSFWLILATMLYQDKPQIDLGDRHDAFMEQVVLMKTNAAGELAYRFSADKMWHYPKGDQIRFTLPRLTLFQPDQTPWQIAAGQGLSEQGGETIRLWQDVSGHQVAGKNNSETTILTQAAVLYPQRRYAQTDQAIIIKQPNAQVTGIGAQVDLEAGMIKLLANTKVLYDPNIKH